MRAAGGNREPGRGSGKALALVARSQHSIVKAWHIKFARGDEGCLGGNSCLRVFSSS